MKMSDSQYAFPLSLLAFVGTGVVFLLQLIPDVGIFLMFAMAPLWSVVLINTGFIGIAIEVLLGRVSRLWIILPLGFYAGYWLAATQDHSALQALSEQFDE